MAPPPSHCASFARPGRWLATALLVAAPAGCSPPPEVLRLGTPSLDEVQSELGAGPWAASEATEEAELLLVDLRAKDVEPAGAGEAAEDAAQGAPHEPFHLLVPGDEDPAWTHWYAMAWLREEGRLELGVVRLIRFQAQAQPTDADPIQASSWRTEVIARGGPAARAEAIDAAWIDRERVVDVVLAWHRRQLRALESLEGREEVTVTELLAALYPHLMAGLPPTASAEQAIDAVAARSLERVTAPTDLRWGDLLIGELTPPSPPSEVPEAPETSPAEAAPPPLSMVAGRGLVLRLEGGDLSWARMEPGYLAAWRPYPAAALTAFELPSDALLGRIVPAARPRRADRPSSRAHVR